MPRYTKNEQRDSMTRESGLRNSKLETRYFYLIPGVSSLGTENYTANG
jgi:hypothetical protein